MINLKQFRKKNNITQSDLAEYLKVGQSFISQIEKGDRPIPSEYIGRILANKQWRNAVYLLTEESEMMKDRSPQTGGGAVVADDWKDLASGKLIPFYDVDAAAGNEYAMSMEPGRQTGLIEIGSVLRDSDSAIRVYGNSMVPNYPSGCIIGLKLHTDSFIEPGRVYVVETRENRYLKRLYYNKARSCFHCLSDNQMKYEDGPRKGELYYQDFEIPINEVVRLHRVVGVIKRNIL